MSLPVLEVVLRGAGGCCALALLAPAPMAMTWQGLLCFARPLAVCGFWAPQGAPSCTAGGAKGRQSGGASYCARLLPAYAAIVRVPSPTAPRPETQSSFTQLIPTRRPACQACVAVALAGDALLCLAALVGEGWARALCPRGGLGAQVQGRRCCCAGAAHSAARRSW